MIAKVEQWHPVLGHNRGGWRKEKKKKKTALIRVCHETFTRKKHETQVNLYDTAKVSRHSSRNCSLKVTESMCLKFINQEALNSTQRYSKIGPIQKGKILWQKSWKADRNWIETIGPFDRKGMSEIWYSPIQASLKICWFLLDLGCSELWWHSSYL